MHRGRVVFWRQLSCNGNLVTVSLRTEQHVLPFKVLWRRRRRVGNCDNGAWRNCATGFRCVALFGTGYKSSASSAAAAAAAMLITMAWCWRRQAHSLWLSLLSSFSSSSLMMRARFRFSPCVVFGLRRVVDKIDVVIAAFSAPGVIVGVIVGLVVPCVFHTSSWV